MVENLEEQAMTRRKFFGLGGKIATVAAAASLIPPSAKAGIFDTYTYNVPFDFEKKGVSANVIQDYEKHITERFSNIGFLDNKLLTELPMIIIDAYKANHTFEAKFDNSFPDDKSELVNAQENIKWMIAAYNVLYDKSKSNEEIKKLAESMKIFITGSTKNFIGSLYLDPLVQYLATVKEDSLNSTVRIGSRVYELVDATKSEETSIGKYNEVVQFKVYKFDSSKNQGKGKLLGPTPTLRSVQKYGSNEPFSITYDQMNKIEKAQPITPEYKRKKPINRK